MATALIMLQMNCRDSALEVAISQFSHSNSEPPKLSTSCVSWLLPSWILIVLPYSTSSYLHIVYFMTDSRGLNLRPKMSARMLLFWHNSKPLYKTLYKTKGANKHKRVNNQLGSEIKKRLMWDRWDKISMGCKNSWRTDEKSSCTGEKCRWIGNSRCIGVGSRSDEYWHTEVEFVSGKKCRHTGESSWCMGEESRCIGVFWCNGENS